MIFVGSFEENAEDECRKNLEAAIETDPSNPEAHHLMASFWLSKDDKEVSLLPPSWFL